MCFLIPSAMGTELRIATINIGKNALEVVLTRNNGNFLSKEMCNKMINSSVATSIGGL